MPDPVIDLTGTELSMVPDVIGQLRSLANGVRRLISLDTRPAFSDPRSYTIDPANASGNENHFQGVAVLGQGGHYIASGSNWKIGCGEAFSFLVNEGSGHGLQARAIDFPLWHSGGIDGWGDLIVLPAECPRFGDEYPGRMAGRARPPESETDRSTIFFLHGSTLEVLPPPIRIMRAGVLATCAGFTRLPDGRFLCLVLAQPNPARVRVDAYLSVGADLAQGFTDQPAWTDEVSTDRLGNYQSISLLTDSSGSVVLAGLLGDTKGRLDVFDLGVATAPPASWARVDSVAINVKPADLRAGACVAAVGGSIRLVAIGRFRHPKNHRLTLVQFTPPLMAPP